MNEKKILYVEDDLSLIEGLKYTASSPLSGKVHSYLVFGPPPG